MKISARKMELAMAQKGINYTRLAELSGISRQSISTTKARGSCRPDTAAKLARGLGVDVTELLEEARP